MSDFLFSEPTRYWIENQGALRRAEVCYLEEWRKALQEAAEREWPGAKTIFKDTDELGRKDVLIWHPNPLPDTGATWQISLSGGLDEVKNGFAVATFDCLEQNTGEPLRKSQNIARLMREDMLPFRDMISRQFEGWNLVDIDTSSEQGTPIKVMIPLKSAGSQLLDDVFRRLSRFVTFAEVASYKSRYDVVHNIQFHPKAPSYVSLADFNGKVSGAKIVQSGRFAQQCLLVDCKVHTLPVSKKEKDHTYISCCQNQKGWFSETDKYRILVVAKTGMSVKMEFHMHLLLDDDVEYSKRYPIVRKFMVEIPPCECWNLFSTRLSSEAKIVDQKWREALVMDRTKFVALIWGESEDFLVDQIVLLREKR